MKVPWLGVEAESLHHSHSNTDWSHICDLRCSLWQLWILNPLNRVRDWTSRTLCWDLIPLSHHKNSWTLPYMLILFLQGGVSSVLPPFAYSCAIGHFSVGLFIFYYTVNHLLQIIFSNFSANFFGFFGYMNILSQNLSIIFYGFYVLHMLRKVLNSNMT